jgi:26S proteasome regulatory subunit RPN5 C-terminal domain
VVVVACVSVCVYRCFLCSMCMCAQCLLCIHPDAYSSPFCVVFLRLRSLLQKTEEYISTMVDRKLIYARINRPARVVGFVPPQQPAERLNDWSDKVTSLLDLLEKNSHLIHRENVLAAAAAK